MRLLRLRYVDGREEELRSFDEPPEVLTRREHTFDRVAVQDGLALYEETAANLPVIALKPEARIFDPVHGWAPPAWRPLGPPSIDFGVLASWTRVLHPGGDDY